MPGFTAYAGLRVIGKPKPGETVVVASASGPVGSLVGQLAKIDGARAVGIAGGSAKCGYVKDELRFDAAIDHRDSDFAVFLASDDASYITGTELFVDGGIAQVSGTAARSTFRHMPICRRRLSCHNSFDNKLHVQKVRDQHVFLDVPDSSALASALLLFL